MRASTTSCTPSTHLHISSIGPYLRPIYDEPEFVVRNIWRYYGGWYDGDPSHLKPAPAAVLAEELAALAGGATRLAERARELAAAGDLRLAGHLAELAAQAAPDDKGVHAVRAEVFGARAREEASTMSKGIFSWAEHESTEQQPSEARRTRRILVTGASSGIGAALAPMLAERGATVGIVARRGRPARSGARRVPARTRPTRGCGRPISAISTAPSRSRSKRGTRSTASTRS